VLRVSEEAVMMF